MKKMLKTSLLLLLSTAFIMSAKAQSTSVNDSFTVAGGKWVVCADTVLKKDFNCTEPYTGFEFLAGGIYREYPKAPTDPNKKFLQGKWMLNKNELTIDQDDEPGTMELPRTFLIVWSDKNHFYSSNKDGKAGPPMYVYFQRLP
jgi:hypothetical protein